jgi:hypothetical protein
MEIGLVFDEFCKNMAQKTYLILFAQMENLAWHYLKSLVPSLSGPHQPWTYSSDTRESILKDFRRDLDHTRGHMDLFLGLEHGQKHPNGHLQTWNFFCLHLSLKYFHPFVAL